MAPITSWPLSITVGQREKRLTLGLVKIAGPRWHGVVLRSSSLTARSLACHTVISMSAAAHTRHKLQMGMGRCLSAITGYTQPTENSRDCWAAQTNGRAGSAVGTRNSDVATRTNTMNAPGRHTR
eukprot:scaffold469_cov142-Isochrysis_galbana.AAC.5